MDGEAGTDLDSDDALATCYAASIQGRNAFGPAAGFYVTRIVDQAMATALYRPGELCAQLGGFSLHARVRVAACARRSSLPGAASRRPSSLRMARTMRRRSASGRTYGVPKSGSSSVWPQRALICWIAHDDQCVTAG